MSSLVLMAHAAPRGRRCGRRQKLPPQVTPPRCVIWGSDAPYGAVIGLVATRRRETPLRSMLKTRIAAPSLGLRLRRSDACDALHAGHRESSASSSRAASSHPRHAEAAKSCSPSSLRGPAGLGAVGPSSHSLRAKVGRIPLECCIFAVDDLRRSSSPTPPLRSNSCADHRKFLTADGGVNATGSTPPTASLTSSSSALSPTRDRARHRSDPRRARQPHAPSRESVVRALTALRSRGLIETVGARSRSATWRVFGRTPVTNSISATPRAARAGVSVRCFSDVTAGSFVSTFLVWPEGMLNQQHRRDSGVHGWCARPTPRSQSPEQR